MELKLFVFVTMCLCVKGAVSYDGYKRRLLFDGNLVKRMTESETLGHNCRHNLCEGDPTYPAERIHHLLHQIKNSPIRFGNVFNSLSRIDISNRMGGTEDDSNYTDVQFCCKSQSVTMYPQSYKDINKNKIYIVNHSSYKQGLRYETCSQTEPLDTCKNSFRNYKCTQKHVIIKLLKYEDGDEKLNYGEIPIPSACVLTLTN